MDRKFYSCVICQPEADYCEWIFDIIQNEKAFVFHEDSSNHSWYSEIKQGDIIILSYKRNFVAYGESTGIAKRVDNEGWTLSIPVKEWYYLNDQDRTAGINRYGVQENSDSNPRDIIKQLYEPFGLKKIEQINTSNELFKKITLEKIHQLKVMKISEIATLLSYKKQIILQGPPGTGKTFTAKDVAESMLTGNVTSDKEKQKDILEQHSDQFKLVQFHPAYSYEDFVRGIEAKPNEKGTGIAYATTNRQFMEIVESANKNFRAPFRKEWITKKFDEFIDKIKAVLEIGDTFPLEKATFIDMIDSDRLHYNKPGWGGDGFYMTLALLRKNIENIPLTKGRSFPEQTGDHIAEFNVRFINDFIDFIGSDRNFKEENKNYCLIIDEINRANLPSVLGELIYALEYRDNSVDGMYIHLGSRKITIPSNLFIIGTMNTADRSVGHIDYAIRRRFAFVNILPSDSVIDDVVPVANDLRRKSKDLYNKVASFFTTEKLMADFKKNEVQLGHSYFLADTEDKLKLKLEYEIKPLLKEYLKDGILKSIKNDKEEDQTEIDIDSLKII